MVMQEGMFNGAVSCCKSMCRRWQMNEIWVWNIDGMTLRGWNKYSDKNLSSQNYVIHHKSDTDWHGIKLSITRWEFGDARLSRGTTYWRWLEDRRGAILKLTVDWIQLLQWKNQKWHFVNTVTRAQARTKSEFLTRIGVFSSSVSVVICVTHETWMDWIVSVRGQIHKIEIQLLKHIEGCLRFSAQWIKTVNTDYKVMCSIHFKFLLAVLNFKMSKNSLDVTTMTDLLGSSYWPLNV